MKFTIRSRWNTGLSCASFHGFIASVQVLLVGVSFPEKVVVGGTTYFSADLLCFVTDYHGERARSPQRCVTAVYLVELSPKYGPTFRVEELTDDLCDKITEEFETFLGATETT